MVTKWIKQLAVPSALAMTACGLPVYAQDAEAQKAVVPKAAVQEDAVQEDTVQDDTVQEATAQDDTAQEAQQVDIVIERGTTLPPGVIRLVNQVVKEEGGATVVAETTESGTEGTVESRFWLGLACEPLTDVLKAQLNIEKGLWVREVFADGPAAKAEVRLFDVLLKINEVDLEDVNQLVGKVEQNGEKEITLKILRGGKEQVLKVVPAARPKSMAVTLKTTFPADDQWKNVEAELKKLREQHKDLELMIVRPGIAFPANRVKAVEVPKDAAISINKQGDKPAEINIKIGDKSWSTTEDKLDELPPEVRVMVEKMRGGAMIRFQNKLSGKDDAGGVLFHDLTTAGPITMRTIPLPPQGAAGAAPGVPPKVSSGLITNARVAGRADAQIDSLNRKVDAILEHLKKADNVTKLQAEVDRLRKDVEELRNQKN